MKVKLIFYLGINLCKYILCCPLQCDLVASHSISRKHFTSFHIWMAIMLNTFCNHIASWTIESFKFMSVRVLFIIYQRKKIWTLFDEWQNSLNWNNIVNFVNCSETYCVNSTLHVSYDTFKLGAIISIFALFGALSLSNWFCCLLMLFERPLFTWRTIRNCLNKKKIGIDWKMQHQFICTIMTRIIKWCIDVFTLCDLYAMST